MDKVIHFEIPYDNFDKAKKFYSEVFGWDIVTVPEIKYNMVTTVQTDPNTHQPKESGAINGGMYKRDADSCKTPVIVIGVKSIDESIDKVKKSGGKIIIPKRQIPNMGFYSQIQDPEGNIIGLWQATVKKE